MSGTDDWHFQKLDIQIPPGILAFKGFLKAFGVFSLISGPIQSQKVAVVAHFQRKCSAEFGPGFCLLEGTCPNPCQSMNGFGPALGCLNRRDASISKMLVRVLDHGRVSGCDVPPLPHLEVQRAAPLLPFF